MRKYFLLLILLFSNQESLALQCLPYKEGVDERWLIEHASEGAWYRLNLYPNNHPNVLNVMINDKDHVVVKKAEVYIDVIENEMYAKVPNDFYKGRHKDERARIESTVICSAAIYFCSPGVKGVLSNDKFFPFNYEEACIDLDDWCMETITKDFNNHYSRTSDTVSRMTIWREKCKCN